jgi:hypothetical protein
MSCKTILGIAAIACVPAVANAGTGFALNDETTLHLTGVGQVRFDDNVLLSENNTESDTVFSAIPGIEVNYDGGLTKGLLNLSEDFEWYADNGRLDAQLFSGLGQLNYQGALTKVDTRISYRQMNQNSVTVRNRDQAIRHDLFDASVDGLWSATAKTSIGAGVFYDQTNYSDIGYADNQNLSLPVDIYYALTPKVDLSVGYRFRQTDVQRVPLAIANYDSKDHFFNLGARGEFTPKLKGQFRVGYGLRDFDHGDTEDQLGLSGALTYSYSPKTSFDLSVSNDFSNSAFGTSQEVFAIRTSGKFEFTPQWSAGLGFSYESTTYDQANSAISSRKDEFFVGDATIAYAMNENVSFQGAYVHRTNSSNRSGLDFNSNILSLGVSLRY